MSDAKALAVWNYVVNLGGWYASDQAAHGVKDYWMDPAGVLFYARGDSEDLAFLTHSLLVNGGVDTKRVRTYFGTYLDVDYGWCAYKRETDDKWIPLDPMNWFYTTNINSITPLSDRTDYYNATGYLTTEAYIPLTPGEYPYTVGAASLTTYIPAAVMVATGYTPAVGAAAFKRLTCLSYGGAIGAGSFLAATMVGVGLPGRMGSSANVVPKTRMAATGLAGVLALGAVTIPKITQVGTGYFVPIGNLSSSFPVVIASGEGDNARFDGYILRHVR